jgi:hypothetical protein
MEKLNHYFIVDMKDKKINLFMPGIDDYFRNTCPRSDRLKTLYAEIESKGLDVAWAEYIAKDMEDLILLDGPKFMMKHISKKARIKLINYIKTRY